MHFSAFHSYDAFFSQMFLMIFFDFQNRMILKFSFKKGKDIFN